MSKRSRRAGPRRIMARARYRLSETITNAVDTLIMFTADDDLTVVRILVDIKVVGASASENCNYDMVLAKAPRGTSVISNPAIGSANPYATDLYTPMEEIARFAGQLRTRGAGIEASPMHNEKHDLKGQRKLKRGDELVLYSITDQVNAIFITGYVTMFFKRT